MNGSLTSDPQSYSSDEAALRNYRSVSLLAVGSLLLGLISWLALLHPLLWPIPWLAVVVSWLALRATQAPDAQLAGGWMAAVGLSLGILFGTWAPASLITKNTILDRQAQSVVQEFFTLVQSGKLLAAHQWTFGLRNRTLNAETLEERYAADEELASAKKRFFEGPALVKWIAASEGAQLTHVKRLQVFRAGKTETVVQLYRLHETNQEPLSCIVAVSCDADKTTDIRNWRIQEVTLEK